MDTDFFDAHRRHWVDAETLFSASRLANADHLFGMSAECGLKSLMVAFGMKVVPNGKPEQKPDQKHVDKIWGRYETYRNGHPSGAAYSLSQNPFHNWHVSQRYARQGDFDHARVTSHRTGAEEVRNLISKARKDGLIT